MAITTIDGAVAGYRPPEYFVKATTATPIVGRFMSTWALGGYPGAGAYDTTASGASLDSSAGPIPGMIRRSDPLSGNAYVGRLTVASNNGGTVLLADRIWQSRVPSVTVTTAQTINSVAFPARDINGSSNGGGYLIGLEVSTTTGAGTPTVTVTYTNELGVTGRTATLVEATAATAPVGLFYRFGLQSGDYGVQSIQSVQLNATWTSGAINLVVYRVLAMIPISFGNIAAEGDFFTLGAPVERNGCVPWLLASAQAATAINLSGMYIQTQG